MNKKLFISVAILLINGKLAAQLQQPPHSDKSQNHVGAEIMATRWLLNDLLKIGEALDVETRALDQNVTELWTQARIHLPVAQIQSGEQTNTGDQLRIMEVMGLQSNTQALTTRSRQMMAHLEKTETMWWKLWHKMQAEVDKNRDAHKLYPEMVKFRSRVSAIADETNALNYALPQLQGQFDMVRSQVSEHLQRTKSVTLILGQPWHWNYILSGRPRPDQRYDFSLKHSEHYDASLNYLLTKKNRS